MMVLVDTSVWSMHLRRSGKSALTNDLEQLIDDERAVMFAPVAQELLSGCRDARQFDRLCEAVAEFEWLLPSVEDYKEAARLSNSCLWRGVQGSGVDFLICAAARRGGMAVYSLDRDFRTYAEVFRLDLFEAI